MARKIPFKNITLELWVYTEDVLKKIVVETDSRLKLASPVDTGRFRASWQVGQNAKPGKGAPPGRYSRAYAIQRVGYGKETLGNVYNIHNSLPYARRLANGWSKQAPSGWIQSNMQVIANWAKTNVRELR